MASFLAWTSQIILLLLGLFLMIIVLLQRGRGGGLAGAFGGMGGQSAFGTKAGDVFTKITIVVALLWVIAAGGSGFFLRAAAVQQGAVFGDDKPAAVLTDPGVPSKPASGDIPALPQPPAGSAGGTTADTDDSATGPALESSATEEEKSATDAEPVEPDSDSSSSADEPASGAESENQN